MFPHRQLGVVREEAATMGSSEKQTTGLLFFLIKEKAKQRTILTDAWLLHPAAWTELVLNSFFREEIHTRKKCPLVYFCTAG